MIKSKKMIITAVAAFIASISFAQEVTFENKLTWGVTDISISESSTDTSLSAFKNKAKSEYSSDKLDLGVEIEFTASKNGSVFEFGSDDFISDAFIEFRPVNALGIGFHRSYPVAGSYLPCLEKELDDANMGSDFGLFVRPVEGLVVAGGLDFISYFGHDDEKPMVNFGAEYTFAEAVAFGFAVRNVVSDERTFGAYASYTGIEGLTLNAGFTYNGNLEDYNVTGNLINAAVMYNINSFGIYANAVLSVGGEADVDNELYSAANLTYMINDTLCANLYGGFSSDFDNDDSWAIEVSPGIGYSFNEHNTVGASVFACIMKDTTMLSFPVYWKYTF